MRTLLLLLLVIVPQLTAQDSTVEQLTPAVISVRPHDPGAWTQGLLLHEGFLYESTGLYGQSSLRRVDPETGDVGLFLPLPEQIFAEGLALVDEHLFQITWREQIAIRYNLTAFTEGEELEITMFEYEGEGWGLCYDGEYLYMSDGTDTLDLRDPETFEIVESVQVTYEDTPLRELALDEETVVAVPTPTADDAPASGQRLDLLNELECVDDSIYANVWQTDTILQIDKATGAVTAHINAAGLLDEDELENADVLNGIAYDPENETFLITGKFWPSIFEVTFEPVEAP